MDLCGGYICNLIATIIGSSVNFYLGRRFGAELVKSFISDEKYEEYVSKMNEGNKFRNLIMVGFVLPLFPDDIFCMIAGMSKLRFREFLAIVVICRPVSLFIYSFTMSNILKILFDLIS